MPLWGGPYDGLKLIYGEGGGGLVVDPVGNQLPCGKDHPETPHTWGLLPGSTTVMAVTSVFHGRRLYVQVPGGRWQVARENTP